MNIGQRVTALLASLACFCLFMALWTAGAFAVETSCGPRAEIVGVLKREYQESRVAIGTISEYLAEVYAGPTKTWTFLVTNAQGKSCIAAAGDNWEAVKPEGGPPL